jgi:hypothetical protein
MSSTFKSQIALLFTFSCYILIRFIGISDISLNVFQEIYFGNVIKDTFLLLALFILSYTFFNAARKNKKTGPTIINGSKLKLSLYIVLFFGWLSVIAHLIFDSIKLFLPFNWLDIYQFADLLDETISHIFLFLSTISSFFIMSLLEIERPLSKAIKKLEINIMFIINLIIGVFWGLNLSEGNLSIFTSLPTMIIFLVIILWLIKKHQLSLTKRPWTLMSVIISLSGSVTYIIWSLMVGLNPQFFSYLK